MTSWPRLPLPVISICSRPVARRCLLPYIFSTLCSACWFFASVFCVNSFTVLPFTLMFPGRLPCVALSHTIFFIRYRVFVIHPLYRLSSPRCFATLSFLRLAEPRHHTYIYRCAHIYVYICIHINHTDIYLASACLYWQTYSYLYALFVSIPASTGTCTWPSFPALLNTGRTRLLQH